MLQVAFEADGRVTVFEMHDGTTLHITADITRLPELLPARVLAEAQDRMAAFLHLTGHRVPKQIGAGPR